MTDLSLPPDTTQSSEGGQPTTDHKQLTTDKAAALDFRPETLDSKKRRPGPPSKISKLPKHHRDRINQLFDEHAPYHQIIEEMADHGITLNHDNLSNWFKYDYQDYLAALEWQQ